MSSQELEESGKCLLSLDGGGVRGLSSLYILQAIMRRLNDEREKKELPPVKPCEVFDLIGGTSTGGLIAIMLGRFEMTVDQCIEAYKDLSQSVFGVPIHRSPVKFNREVQPRFDSNKLREAIQATMKKYTKIPPHAAFNAGRTGCRVFVCTKSTEMNHVELLRTYNTRRSPSGINVSICDAAMATTAAPKLFETFRVNGRGYVDGALGANNPVEYVESEASNIWCPDSGDLKPLVKCFISIGTGRQNPHAIKEDVLKFLTKTVVGIATETEQTAHRFIDRWRSHYDSGRYFRLNVDHGLQGVGLAEYTNASSIEVATSAYLETQPVDFQMRDLVASLTLKKNRTGGRLESLRSHATKKFPSYLSKCQYRDDKNRNEERIEGTCQWFLTHPLFRAWEKKKGHAFLWVTADPGCGKSVLARSLVDDHLRPPLENRIICYFFFKDDFESQKKLSYAISCLLHQIFSQRRELLTDAILEKLEEAGEAICESFSDLWSILVEASQGLISEQIFCVLDAFDECEETGRQDLVSALTKLYDPAKAPFHTLKFLVTSRYYGNCRWGFQRLQSKLSNFDKIRLGGDEPETVDKMSSDINIVIKARVKKLGVQRGLSSQQQTEIQEKIMSRDNRTYLWVHLVFEALEKTGELQETLAELPRSVNDAYEKILVKTFNMGRTRRLLEIILAAESVMTEREVKVALTSNSNPFLDDGWDRPFDLLKELCGLVVMRDSKIYLLHQTVREFLIRKKHRDALKSGADRPVWEKSFTLKEAHGVLCGICVRHLLSLPPDGASSETTSEVFSHGESPETFSAYAAMYWTTHYKKTGLAERKNLAEPVGRLLTNLGSNKQWLGIRWERQPKRAPQNVLLARLASTLNLPVPEPPKREVPADGPVAEERMLRKQLAFVTGGLYSLGELTDDELKKVGAGLKKLQVQLFEGIEALAKRSPRISNEAARD